MKRYVQCLLEARSSVRLVATTASYPTGEQYATLQAARKHAAKVGKLSPIPSGKVFGKRSNSSHGSPEEGAPVRLLASLRSLHRKSNNSGPPSPTVSDDSEGSGATFRSAESLHRPTPIPQDAASSYAL